MREWGTGRGARLGALVLFAAGTAVGIVASGGPADRWVVAIVAGVLLLGLAPVLWGSRHAPVVPVVAGAGAAAPPTILVLVAAHDEASVLPALVGDLAVQDHRRSDGTALFEVVVVDDRSTDGTAEAVGQAARDVGLDLRVVRRPADSLIHTKGAALAAARAEASDADVIVVLDADARIGPDFLRRAAEYVAAGFPAVTARRRMLRAGRSLLAGAQADEQTQDGELQRGRWATGGCSEFRGNGMVIRRDLLAAVGGFPVSSLTEDLDLSARVAAGEGATVAWALDLEVWEQGAPTWRSLWRQRLRWSEGGLRRLLTVGPAVLASRRLSLRGRLDFAAYGGQLIAPPVILGALLGAATTGGTTLAVGLIASYLVAGGVLSFDSLRWERDAEGRAVSLPDRLARSIRAALFSLVWLAALNGALLRIATRRGPVRFDRTARAGASTGSAPEPAAMPGHAER